MRIDGFSRMVRPGTTRVDRRYSENPELRRLEWLAAARSAASEPPHQAFLRTKTLDYVGIPLSVPKRRQYRSGP